MRREEISLGPLCFPSSSKRGLLLLFPIRCRQGNLEYPLVLFLSSSPAHKLIYFTPSKEHKNGAADKKGYKDSASPSQHGPLGGFPVSGEPGCSCACGGRHSPAWAAFWWVFFSSFFFIFVNLCSESVRSWLSHGNTGPLGL